MLTIVLSYQIPELPHAGEDAFQDTQTPGITTRINKGSQMSIFLLKHQGEIG